MTSFFQKLALISLDTLSTVRFSLRRTAAVAVVLALLIPIAIPIPVFGSSVISKSQPALGLVFEKPLMARAADLLASVSGTVGLIAGKIAGADKKPANNPVEKRSKKVANVIASAVDNPILKVGESRALATIPVDAKGKTVNGVKIEWKSSNGDVVKIKDNQLFALKIGEAKLTVKAGNFVKEQLFTVINEPTETPSELVMDDMEEEEYRSFFTPQENLGTPPGQVEAQSASRAAALGQSRERPGSSNFSFDVPVASLPGRGSDAGIGMTYNSRLWSLYQPPFATPPRYRYNQYNDWIAPGFTMSLGSLQYLSYNHLSLTSPDGTKHQMYYVSGNNFARTYESFDGTFIRADLTSSNGQNVIDSPMYVTYPDGSKVVYSKQISSSPYFYPTKITDSNGNVKEIAYQTNDAAGRISYIKDTLGRYINFHYDSGNKLVAVTVPGFDGGDERQTIRFYYETITFDTTTDRFEGPITYHSMPLSADVLRYVYFPGTQSGYEYEYSAAWGMIYKVSSLRGMTVSSTSLTSTGSVTSEGEVAATTTYNYPLTLGSPLTEVPAYTTRTDDWLGRTTASAPVTSYSVYKNTSDSRVETRITAPDGTITETWSKAAPNDWDDGLVTDTFIKTQIGSFPETVWSHTKTFWGNQPLSQGRKNLRIDKIETTNDANQTRATAFVYDTYNNQTFIREYDFAAPGSLGTELRRTEMTYETGSNWLNNRLVNLPKSVQTFVNSTVVSRTDYEYDGEPLLQYGSTPITQHDTAYNPGTGGFNSATNYRGNVSKVTAFADPTNSSDPDMTVTTMKYDVTGNLIETGADCCKERAWEFTNVNHYAYPVSQADGDVGQIETGFTYDLNTGLLLTTTDPNLQTTSYTYNADSLRQTRVDLSNGAWATTEFNDSAFPYHVKSTSSLDATRSVSSWNFINGIGQGFRSRNQTSGGYLSSDVEFDNMGRPAKSFNPYTVSGLTDARPGGIKFTSMTEFDGLGRVLETTLPDETTVQNEYSGLIATMTDQAGKKRRQVADSLGRIVRVDEPDANGNLGAVSTPNQPTYYEYDANDNLTKVTQSDGTNTQERLFKYDGLSRLTHEKQVEANATLNDSGVHVGGSGTWTGRYKYNTDNLVIEAFDARGVKSAFAYDGLNRIASVVYTGETGYQTPQITYTYDETETNTFNKGRLTKVRTADNSTYGTPETIQNYRYDKTGQVIKHTQSIGSESYLQEYSYNLAGQLTAQKYPSGRIVETEIDNFGRMAEVSDSERTYVSGLTFNSQGSLSQLNLGNGTHETYSYNDRFQMTSQSLMKGSTVLQKYDYGYGQTDVATGTVDATKNNGQLAKIESFIGANKQASQRFAYDQLGRLKEAREHRGDNDSLTYKQVFDFDRFGNKYHKAANNPTTGQANPLPYTPIEETDISKGTNRFTTGTTYDDAGQVVADNKFRSFGFAYDANGRQVKATKTNQPDAWTVYDALGNRVATKSNDMWQFMIYDAFGKLVAEYGVSAETTGGVKYVQQDWQGSIRAVTNSNGFVVARTDHQAFGEDIGIGVGLRSVEQGFSADKATRQGYGLTEDDKATGQQHTWFRKLETQAGRWTRPDPYKGSMRLGDPQSFNRYAYVGNDPTNFVDPSGLLICYLSYSLSNDRWVPEVSCSPGNDRAGGHSGGGPSSSGPRGGGSRQNSGNEKADQQRDIERCARTMIRGARRQALKDIARAQATLVVTGGVVALGLLGGVGGKFGAAIIGPYLAPEIKGIGERAIDPQIFRRLDHCRRLYPGGVLDAGIIARLAATTTI